MVSRALHFTKGVPSTWHEKMVMMEAKWRSDAIKRRYNHDMRIEFDSIKNWLPKNAKACLDIGSGVAGLDALIYHHYDDEELKLHLLDKTKVEEGVFYKYQEKAEFYSDMSAAEAVMMANDVSTDQVKFLEATEDGQINLDKGLDLVVSIYSWGFHYPVELYLDRVQELMNSDGRLILDVRNNTGGLELLKQRWRHCKVIRQNLKSQRVCCSNSKNLD